MNEHDTVQLTEEVDIVSDGSQLSDNSDWETVFSDDDYDELDYEDDHGDEHMSLDDMHFTYGHPDEPAPAAKPVTHTFMTEATTDEEMRIEAWLVDSSPAPMPLEVELDLGDMPFEVYEEPIPVVRMANSSIARHTITTKLKRLLQRRHMKRVRSVDMIPSDGVAVDGAEMEMSVEW